MKLLIELSYAIIGCAYKVHSELGPGLLESTYETYLEYKLIKKGLHVERQKHLPIVYSNVVLDNRYRVDLMVERKIIVEIKSCESIPPIYEAQLLTYLKLAGIKLGLLLNFNVKNLQKGIIRRVM